MEALATDLVGQGFEVIPMHFLTVVRKDGHFITTLPRGEITEEAWAEACPDLEDAGFRPA